MVHHTPKKLREAAATLGSSKASKKAKTRASKILNAHKKAEH